jgi:selenide,water dikinase
VAGGHSIDSGEPIYGLVAIGLVDPKRLKRNGGALPGDRLILGKPLGVGVYGAALKKEQLDAGRYRAMIDCATRLNTPGIKLGAFDEVHALTDVTGFGLLGHLLEVCRASNVGAALEWARVPLLPGVADLVREGHQTGGSARNWASYGASVDLGDLGEVEQALLTDPQTSGGLLVSCAPNAVDQVLEAFHSDGFGEAAVIGEIVAGQPTVVVERGDPLYLSP